MEIILLRHGKPKVELKGSLNAQEFKQLVSEYANSGIHDTPPEQLKNNFNDYFVVCSDLPRSIESAKKLNLTKINYSDGLFKEIDIPHFDKSTLRLPVIIWLALLRIMWLFGFSKNGESFSQAKTRSHEAAEKLIMLAKKNKKIIVVGHGLMNLLIAKQLEKNSWKRSRAMGKRYWASSSYSIHR